MATNRSSSSRPSSSLAYAHGELQVIADAIFNAALEPSSHEVYASHQRSYIAFCRANNLTPFPVSKTSLQLYAAHWVITGHAHTTLPSIFSSLKHVHRQQGWPWLTDLEQQWFACYMRGIRKAFPHQPRRKQPMVQSILHALAARADFSQLHVVQYITMAFLAHDGLLRAAELLQLQLSDVHWSSDHVRLRIRKSKANKLSGQPEFVYIYPSTSDINGFSTLRAYWTRRNLNHASDPHLPLFPASDGASPLPKKAWIDYIQAQLATLGLDPTQFSGHSFRSGGATDLWTAGTRPRVIQKHGRWLSDAFWLYIRDNPSVTAREVAAAFSRLSQLAI